jgi:hypothetical protein
MGIHQSEVMTTGSRRWNEFADRLDEALAAMGCASRRGPNPYHCAKQVMTAMGNIDIPASIDFFENHGGNCDCEILLNIDWCRTDDPTR